MPTQTRPNFRGVQTWLWPVVILIIAFAAFYFKPWQKTNAETISVTAEGKTQTTPDIAQITATVESRNQNLDLARQENDKKVAQIIEKLTALGVDKKDIKTQSLSAQPIYEPQTLIYPAPPKPNNNNFSTSLEITIRSFEKADEIVATLTQNGAANLYGPSLTLSQDAQSQAKSKAREKAVEDARLKAQELAKLSQRKLGKVTSIVEQGDVRYPMPLIAANEMDLKQKAAQIQPGQNEVSISLKVDFALK